MQSKVVNLWRRALASVGAAIVLVSGSSSASATTTLDWEISDISCGVRDFATGATVFSTCSSSSFEAQALPGQVAFLRTTVSYHYSDDGLPLGYPARFQTDPFGAGTIAEFESAGFSARGSGCVRSNCNPDLGGVGFQSTILGLNDLPDHFSGTATLETFLAPTPIYSPSGASATLFIEVSPIVFTAAIPEPTTWALMACGLLGLAVHSRRRTSRRRAIAG